MENQQQQQTSSWEKFVKIIEEEMKQQEIKKIEEEQKICSLCEGIIGGDDADIDCNCGNEEDE